MKGRAGPTRPLLFNYRADVHPNPPRDGRPYHLTDGFDVGTDLGSPVSPAYFDDAPFPFNGQIEKVRVEYTR